MALSANKISAGSTPGMAAAASARLFSGGRGVAEDGQFPVEATGFAPQIGVNDNSILHHDDQKGNGTGGQKDPRKDFFPFVASSTFSFQPELEDPPASGGHFFLLDLVHATGIYEHNMNVVSPDAVHRGSVLNQFH